MALVLKNGKKFNNCYTKFSKDKKSKKDKKIMLVSNKFFAPLHSWPTDKERLLYLIDNYLSQIELDKLSAIADKFDDGQEDEETVEMQAEETPQE